MTSGWAVLGIDAAWTARNPSGVALVEVKGSRPLAIAAAPSYEAFVRGEMDWQARHSGDFCDAAALLEAARRLTPLPVRCVSVDMALSRTAITGRRAADNLVSSAFGAAWCGTHSPNPSRPGEVSLRLVRQFEELGFPLATTAPRSSDRALIEVHPHAALVRLTREKKRLPYKVSRLRQYHPNAPAGERKVRLLRTWRRIARSLEGVVEGAGAFLPADLASFRVSRLKAVEDTLDALICTWIGAEFVRKKAEAFGDEDAAIWVPRCSPSSIEADFARFTPPANPRCCRRPRPHRANPDGASSLPDRAPHDPWSRVSPDGHEAHREIEPIG